MPTDTPIPLPTREELEELERLAYSEPEDGMGGDFVLRINEARGILSGLRRLRELLKGSPRMWTQDEFTRFWTDAEIEEQMKGVGG